MKCVYGVCCAAVVLGVGGIMTGEIKGMEEINYSGIYSQLDRYRIVVRGIDGFQESSVEALCESLRLIDAKKAELTQIEREAFKAFLEKLSCNVPGENQSTENDIEVIAVASILCGYYRTVKEAKESWGFLINSAC
jgi:hypothetical protein